MDGLKHRAESFGIDFVNTNFSKLISQIWAIWLANIKTNFAITQSKCFLRNKFFTKTINRWFCHPLIGNSVKIYQNDSIYNYTIKHLQWKFHCSKIKQNYRIGLELSQSLSATVWFLCICKFWILICKFSVRRERTTLICNKSLYYFIFCNLSRAPRLYIFLFIANFELVS